MTEQERYEHDFLMTGEKTEDTGDISSKPGDRHAICHKLYTGKISE